MDVGVPLASATVHEATGQRGALPRAIKPVRAGLRVQGPAFTVLCAPRDNLALHHAIAAAPAGSILVCHTSGYYDAGYFGDVMAEAAAARGIAGLVIDGCVRDAATIRISPVAVFARGLSIRGTTKDPLLPGALGTRLRFDDIDVNPGDLVVADDDGVVVVPAATVPAAVEASEAREAKEAAIRDRLVAGELTTNIFGLPSLGE